MRTKLVFDAELKDRGRILGDDIFRRISRENIMHLKRKLLRIIRSISSKVDKKKNAAIGDVKCFDNYD